VSIHKPNIPLPLSKIPLAESGGGGEVRPDPLLSKIPLVF
jgi:hypothetical protein